MTLISWNTKDKPIILRDESEDTTISRQGGQNFKVNYSINSFGSIKIQACAICQEHKYWRPFIKQVVVICDLPWSTRKGGKLIVLNESTLSWHSGLKMQLFQSFGLSYYLLSSSCLRLSSSCSLRAFVALHFFSRLVSLAIFSLHLAQSQTG